MRDLGCSRAGSLCPGKSKKTSAAGFIGGAEEGGNPHGEPVAATAVQRRLRATGRHSTTSVLRPSLPCVIPALPLRKRVASCMNGVSPTPQFSSLGAHEPPSIRVSPPHPHLALQLCGQLGRYFFFFPRSPPKSWRRHGNGLPGAKWAPAPGGDQAASKISQSRRAGAAPAPWYQNTAGGNQRLITVCLPLCCVRVHVRARVHGVQSSSGID